MTQFSNTAANTQPWRLILTNAPLNWQSHEQIRSFKLPNGESISCVLWEGRLHISGTDIVKVAAMRFAEFGRPVANQKKFEEGIFSDLRNLKAGVHSTLEEPRSAFLELLHSNNCIRTQKKQKVFHWFSVPHDRLFMVRSCLYNQIESNCTRMPSKET